MRYNRLNLSSNSPVEGSDKTTTSLDRKLLQRVILTSLQLPTIGVLNAAECLTFPLSPCGMLALPSGSLFEVTTKVKELNFNDT